MNNIWMRGRFVMRKIDLGRLNEFFPYYVVTINYPIKFMIPLLWSSLTSFRNKIYRLTCNDIIYFRHTSPLLICACTMLSLLSSQFWFKNWKRCFRFQNFGRLLSRLFFSHKSFEWNEFDPPDATLIFSQYGRMCQEYHVLLYWIH